MRTVYLGTSDFAAAVLERLAESAHRPALVVTRPDRPRGRGRKLAAPPVADAARALGIERRPARERQRRRGAGADRRRPARRVCVCAFGALIKEPLLSEHPMLNVHPSLLPRWRGAAPVERAIMAGDAETGVSIMRVTAELDSGPVALRQAEPIQPDDTYGTLAPRLARLGGELLVRALDEWPLELEEQDDGARDLRREDRAPPTARSTRRARRTSSSASCGRCTPHIGARIALPGGDALGVHEAAPAPAGPAAGASWPRATGACCGAARAARSSCRGPAARRAPDGRGRLPARASSVSATPARRVAHAVLRRTFEEGAYADRALHRRGRRAGLDARERAFAMRLAYGAVQRRDTLDHVIGRLAGRPPDSSTRRCSTRCGSACSSCSSSTGWPATPRSASRSS